MTTDTLNLALVLPPAVLSCIAVIALVVCDYREIKPGRFIFKPLAAAAFIWLALRLGALDSVFGCWMLAGLALCMVGDLFLMPDDQRSFLAGLVAFLCGHLLYAVAFLQLPHSTTGLLVSALPGLLLVGLVLRWLLPHVGRDMKIPVAVYTLVITGMLLCAGLTAGHAAAPLIIGGAWAFAASDIAVARQEFAKPQPLNRLWGTPLYFFAQMVLATTVALV